MANLVSIRNLTKTYQRGPEKVEVLHGIDLDIEEGDFVALMGPSGSGKTTLLNLIGGLDSPTTGSIEVAGQRIDQLNGGQLSPSSVARSASAMPRSHCSWSAWPIARRTSRPSCPAASSSAWRSRAPSCPILPC